MLAGISRAGRRPATTSGGPTTRNHLWLGRAVTHPCAPATPISGVLIECWGAARRLPLLLQPPLHSVYRPVRCVLGRRRSPARGHCHLLDRVESEEASCPGADITGNA